jgi:hypothetical protein
LITGWLVSFLTLLFGAIGSAANASIFSMTSLAVLRGMAFNVLRAAFEYSI